MDVPVATGPVAERAGYPLLMPASPTDLGAATRTWLVVHVVLVGEHPSQRGGDSGVAPIAA